MSVFLFSSFPYIAVALLMAGVLARYAASRKRMESVAGDCRDAVDALCTGRAWRAGLLALLLLHLAGWLFPRSILWWNGSDSRLYLLEGAAFISGAVALAGGARVVWRNLGRSGRAAGTEIADAAFLALLLVGIVSGLAMAAIERWGSTWGAMTLAPYMTSLLRGKPEIVMVTGMPFLVRLHLVSAFAALAVLPGTRLASLLVAGLHRCFGAAVLPLNAAERLTQSWLQKHNLAGKIWPEED